MDFIRGDEGGLWEVGRDVNGVALVGVGLGLDTGLDDRREEVSCQFE